MDFDFSSEQKMLKDQARKFLAERCTPEVVRRVFEADEDYAAEVWKGLGELGFTGAGIPEAYGGLGMGALELCVIAEELGRALAPVPFSSSICLAAEGLVMAGSDAQKKDWLPRLASGEAIGTLAAGTDAAHVRFDGGKLTGETWPVADGMVADMALVRAEGKGVCLVLVRLDGTGVKRTPIRTIDPSRRSARIRFDGAAAEMLGDGKDAEEVLNALLARAAIIMAFEQLGGADAALDMACDYARTRYAFGRPIGSFQAIKHKLANLYIGNELARANCYYAAMTRAQDGADMQAAAAAARISASDAFVHAAQENVQTHGGIGFTWESNCQLYYRRARMLALALGSQMQWKERLAREVERRNIA